MNRYETKVRKICTKQFENKMYDDFKKDKGAYPKICT